MKKMKKIITVIPARGGSKGIIRKNVRLLGGKPLIAYSIETALKSKYVDDVVVSTEDSEIAEISKVYGALIIKRPEKLARDDTPLDPVIVHAVETMEREKNIKYDLVVTIQPTSPLLALETLDKAIKIMLAGNYDTLLPVGEKTHLYWTKKSGKFMPIYKERVNRQYLDPIYQEKGTPLTARRETMKSGTRIGKKKFLFEVPDREGIDIDNALDWKIVETLLGRLKIVFRVKAGRRMGTGHVCRVLVLADKLRLDHEVCFLVEKKRHLAMKKIKEHSHKIISFEGERDFFRKIKKINPHIVINDILGTKKKYIEELRERGYFVANFDDLGEGSKVADLVINAIYEDKSSFENHYYGYRYMCLRDEFSIVQPKRKTSKKVKSLLITFGGSDPNNLTSRTLKAIEKLGFKDISINIILGIGYKQKKELYDYISILKKRGFRINIKEDIKMMTQEIRNADIVVTSNGITVYEVATMRTPCISISQNEVEKKHSFAQNVKYIKYLGSADTLSVRDIASAIRGLVSNYKLREEIRKGLSEFDSSKGRDKVLRLIFNNYYGKEENKNR